MSFGHGGGVDSPLQSNCLDNSVLGVEVMPEGLQRKRLRDRVCIAAPSRKRKS